jgi:hypothetical protein
MEENIKTAISFAVFQYVSEHADDDFVLEDKNINKILGRKEETKVSKEARETLNTAGFYQHFLIDALGNTVLKSLGLEAIPSAGQELTAKLRTALGTHALNLAEEVGLLQATPVTSTKINELRKEGLSRKGLKALALANAKSDIAGKPGNQYFYAIKRKEYSNEISEAVAVIRDSSRDTQNILPKLFGVDVRNRWPSLSPVKFIQEFAVNTRQNIPKFLRKVLNKKQKEPYNIKKDNLSVLDALTGDYLARVLGAAPVSDETTHVVNRSKRLAKNKGLQKEFKLLKEYADSLPDGLDTQFYFNFSVWKQQRVGIENSNVNPQASLVARYLVASNAWKADIALNNKELMDSFFLRVGEGLGIKTERADKEIHLGVVKRIVKETIYVDAIAALHKKLIQEETLTEKDQEAISKAVEEGGESVHTLDVLVNMVYHNEAVKKSESSGKEDVIFSVQMLGLVDGVASGTMLNHILFGAADSVSELLAIGEQGGIYDETYDSYPEWRGKSGHKDIYETTGKLALRRIGQNEDITASIKSSIKALSAGSELFKGDARALIKDAMNPLIFGAGMDRVRENLADTFINSVYVGFEDLATKGASREAINEYVGHINNLLGVAISQGVPKMPLNKPIKYYINTPLTTDRKKQTGQGTLLIGKFETAGQETALRIIFNNIVGTAVTETLASEFETFLDRRAEFNKSAQTSYGLYEAVYTGERETYIQELVESGEIQKNAAGQPAADLSREQEATLQLRLEAIVPLIASAMAKGDEKNTGLLMANYERSVADSQDTQYQNITEFGKPNAKGFKSTAARGYKRHLKEIGISMGSWIIHSFDSQLSHLTQAERNVLNIHDAVGDGIAGLATSAELINKNTWKSLLTYSPAAEMELSLNGVVQGIAAMAEKGELSPQSIRNLNVFLNKSAKATDGQPDETSSDEILLKLITDTKYNAYIADTMKLGAMSEWFNVNQYAFQGGAYEVTFGDRAAAVKAQSELVVDVDPQTVTAIEALNKALNKKSNVKALTGAVATPIIPDLDQLTKTAFGPLGTPAVQSDPDLVALFKDNKTTAKEAIAVLIKKYELDTELPNRDFNIKLLKKIRKAVPAGLSIEQITSKTKEEDVIGLPSNTDVFGWAVFKPGAKEQAIYVLNSEFQNSGLTPELLLHELVHAAVVTRVRGKDKAVAPFVSELNALLKQAKRYVENNKATFTVEQNARFRAATSNLDELIAWGMTNLDFQKEVLDKIVVNPKSKPKAIKTALKTFIKNITGLLFGAWSSSDPEYVRSTAFSGMEALIHNVSNVIELANSKEINKNSVIDETITVAMSAEAKSDAAIDSYTTLEVFNSFPNNGKVAPEFETHLRGLLEGIVDKLHGPFGSFKEGLQKNAASTPLDVWLKALDTGKAPFASEVLNSGFTDNGQQSFVIEQVDATVRDALETKDKGMVSEGIRRELARLFTETKAQLTPEDFKGKFGTNTIEEATALYNFVFDAKTSTDRKSDYLARFAALGLAHEGFNDLLKIATKRRVDSKGKTFIERLEALFNSILDFYARMVTGVNKNDTAKARLSNLVERLVDIEAKRRHTLKREAQGQNTTIDAIETKSREAVDKLMKAVSKALKAPIVRKSKSSVVKAAGAAVRTIAEGRLQGVLQVMIEFKDSQTTGQLNIGQGVINAIKTPLEAFKILVRGRKHLEGLTVAQVASVGTLLKDAFKNQDLDEDTRAAVTAVFLRTGVHNLVTAGFSLTDIENLIANPIALKAAIGKLEGNLSQFGALKTEFIANASALGYHKVGGRVAVQELKQNAHQITRRFGVNRDIDKLNAKQLERADAIVKPLITLYALLHMEKGAKTKEQTVIAKDLMKLENSRTIEEGNGIELTIILQKALEEQALNELFAGNEALMFHAYVPEIYNYRTKIQTANEIDGRELINQGYTKSIQAVVLDPGDIDQSVKHVYKLTDGGAPPHLTAAMGYGSLKAKGTAAYDNYMQPNSALGNANIQAQAAVTSHRQRNTKALKINFDPATVKENYMAPVYNEAGKIVSHRYLMLTGTKDTLLERNSDFLKVLGELAGSIQGKQNTVKQNKVAITAMLEQYKEEYAVRGKSYMLVGEDSTDPELKAIWYKLPQKTKDDIKEAWGRNGVMVRRDAIDILFGYPKISAADPFRRANEERLRKPGTTLRDLKSVNEAQKLIIYIVEGILKVNHIRRGHTAEEANNYAKRAANLVAKSENVWQGVITEVKDIIVVKSGVVLLGNITSNFSMLYLQGVPVTDMFRLTWVAYNGASEFKADNNELNSLRISLATGYTKGDAKRIKNRIVELEDSIARNPVAPLINAGLMPTIVEDLDMSEDKYSFKSVLTKKVEKQLNRLPDGAVKTLRMAYMTRDGKAYQKLAHITQMSDFTARYVMYHHQTTRTKDRISHEEALQRASNAFVNYDIPLHRWLQYTDDMGFTMFTKYFLYIQSELLRVTKENPARVLSLLMMQNYLDFLPPHILESSAVAHTGNNPIGGGILRYPEAVQKIPSWVGAMAILK